MEVRFDKTRAYKNEVSLITQLLLTLKGKVVMTVESGDMLEPDLEGGSMCLPEDYKQFSLLEHLLKSIFNSVASY